MGRETAATLKNPRSDHRPQTFPRAGTRTRAVYDLFMHHRGTIVSALAIGDTHILDYLRDMYLLDIRRVGYGQYRLCGRWMGDTYEDFIAPLFMDPKEDHHVEVR